MLQFIRDHGGRLQMLRQQWVDQIAVGLRRRDAARNHCEESR
jgi:hypothetical protein